MPKFLNKFMPKQKINTGQPLPITPGMKIKLAERTMTDKINKLADWLESQKDWNLMDGWVVMEFIQKQSLEPQMTPTGVKKAQEVLDAFFVEKEEKPNGKQTNKHDRRRPKKTSKNTKRKEKVKNTKNKTKR